MAHEYIEEISRLITEDPDLINEAPGDLNPDNPVDAEVSKWISRGRPPKKDALASFSPKDQNKIISKYNKLAAREVDLPDEPPKPETLATWSPGPGSAVPYSHRDFGQQIEPEIDPEDAERAEKQQASSIEKELELRKRKDQGELTAPGGATLGDLSGIEDLQPTEADIEGMRAAEQNMQKLYGDADAHLPEEIKIDTSWVTQKLKIATTKAEEQDRESGWQNPAGFYAVIDEMKKFLEEGFGGLDLKSGWLEQVREYVKARKQLGKLRAKLVTQGKEMSRPKLPKPKLPKPKGGGLPTPAGIDLPTPKMKDPGSIEAPGATTALKMAHQANIMNSMKEKMPDVVRRAINDAEKKAGSKDPDQGVEHIAKLLRVEEERANLKEKEAAFKHAKRALMQQLKFKDSAFEMESTIKKFELVKQDLEEATGRVQDILKKATEEYFHRPLTTIGILPVPLNSRGEPQVKNLVRYLNTLSLMRQDIDGEYDGPDFSHLGEKRLEELRREYEEESPEFEGYGFGPGEGEGTTFSKEELDDREAHKEMLEEEKEQLLKGYAERTQNIIDYEQLLSIDTLEDTVRQNIAQQLEQMKNEKQVVDEQIARIQEKINLLSVSKRGRISFNGWLANRFGSDPDLVQPGRKIGKLQPGMSVRAFTSHTLNFMDAIPGDLRAKMIGFAGSNGQRSYQPIAPGPLEPKKGDIPALVYDTQLEQKRIRDQIAKYLDKIYGLGNWDMDELPDELKDDDLFHRWMGFHQRKRSEIERKIRERGLKTFGRDLAGGILDELVSLTHSGASSDEMAQYIARELEQQDLPDTRYSMGTSTKGVTSETSFGRYVESRKAYNMAVSLAKSLGMRETILKVSPARENRAIEKSKQIIINIDSREKFLERKGSKEGLSDYDKFRREEAYKRIEKAEKAMAKNAEVYKELFAADQEHGEAMRQAIIYKSEYEDDIQDMINMQRKLDPMSEDQNVDATSPTMLTREGYLELIQNLIDGTGKDPYLQYGWRQGEASVVQLPGKGRSRKVPGGRTQDKKLRFAGKTLKLQSEDEIQGQFNDKLKELLYKSIFYAISWVEAPIKNLAIDDRKKYREARKAKALQQTVTDPKTGREITAPMPPKLAGSPRVKSKAGSPKYIATSDWGKGKHGGSLGTEPPKKEESRIRAGDLVEIQGIKDSPELNGLKGHVRMVETKSDKPVIVDLFKNDVVSDSAIRLAVNETKVYIKGGNTDPQPNRLMCPTCSSITETVHTFKGWIHRCDCGLEVPHDLLSE